MTRCSYRCRRCSGVLRLKTTFSLVTSLAFLYVCGFFTGLIIGCSATGKVTGGYAGGLVGSVGPGGKIVACHSAGEVEGYYAGGISSSFSYGHLIGCYSTANVKDEYGAGGICRSIVNPGAFIGNYWKSNTDVGIDGRYDIYVTIEATEVDGTDVTWKDAIDAMNAALIEWNENNEDHDYYCSFHYEQTNGVDKQPVLVDGARNNRYIYCRSKR